MHILYKYFNFIDILARPVILIILGEHEILLFYLDEHTASL
jgi:hypothetical protein